ncbi:MAG: hypothetical protein AMS14_08530 [Planctomycetes bacterium DG_20]|nr:MAG: hypothetical protein AMS14_08530 [Planctomycetes bacterium DG_20]
MASDAGFCVQGARILDKSVELQHQVALHIIARKAIACTLCVPGRESGVGSDARSLPEQHWGGWPSV